MTGKYKAPRGTTDVLPEDQPYWDRIWEASSRICGLFGYRRIETPVFEEASLFTRGVGEVTDIVQKEMYVFQDRGGSEGFGQAHRCSHPILLDAVDRYF